MAIRKILHFPHPNLRIKGDAVTHFGKELQSLLSDMYETMYANAGVGLAATQIDIHQQVAVIDISEDKSQAFCIINPEIVSQTGSVKQEEGCLSVPEVYDTVNRSEHVTCRYQDETGQQKELSADGLLAIAIQHEIDHLNGKLFIDKLSSIKRDRLQKKLQAPRRDTP